MTLTATQTERLNTRFAKWDNDGDGDVDKKDFELEARRILSNMGESESSAKGSALMSAYLGMWDSMAAAGGIPVTGSFTVEEFARTAGSAAIEGGEEAFNQTVAPCIQAIVDLLDTDDDDQVSPEEFNKWLDAIGVDRSKAQEAFSAIDTNGNGYLTTEELVAAVRAYHLGELDAPLLGD